MDEVRVETGVDELIRYLRTKGKVSLKEASTHLNIPEQTLQLWLDFLVEERIIGMEYKFTKPYIFLNEDDKSRILDSKEEPKKDVTIDTFKEEFFANAKRKQMPESKIPMLWQAHLTTDIERQKEFFMAEANKRSIKNPERVFAVYKRRLLEM